MSKESNLSPATHTAIGAVAGMVEVCVMQPTVAVKNALQEGRPLPSSPGAYYRGLLVSLSIVGVCAGSKIKHVALPD